MRSITIQPIPSQKFNIALDGNKWDIKIKDCNGSIAVSLSRSAISIIDNVRAVAGTKIIPCKYQEAGNFFFTSQNYEVLDYTKFGVTQFLYYATQDEIDAIRNQPEKIIRATDFDPNGDLPQSFAPKGYRLA